MSGQHRFSGVSADGRWLAFVSNQSQQWETYIASLPDGAITRQVSRHGGTNPTWTKTGSVLYYRRPHDIQPGEIMRVTVGADGSVTTPTLALKGDYFRSPASSLGARDYDVFPDGAFLMLREEGTPAAPRIEVVVNWASQHRLTGADGRLPR
jgi:Tol biopolymer transport system component